MHRLARLMRRFAPASGDLPLGRPVGRLPFAPSPARFVLFVRVIGLEGHR
jgi:hypothetical protein